MGNFIREHKKDIISYAITVAVVFGIIWTSRLFITPLVVSGHSMDNTLSNGMFGYALKTKNDTEIERCDIVIAYAEDHYIIKRVIGLPGETVSEKNGIVYINGEPLEEPYTSTSTNDFDEITLGEDEYFLLGDNRQNSKDSREIGPVKKECIKAKGFFVINSLDHFGVAK